MLRGVAFEAGAGVVLGIFSVSSRRMALPTLLLRLRAREYKKPFSSPLLKLPLVPLLRGRGMSRSMCSCGIGRGLERGRGMREELFRESDCGWRYPVAESVSMWLPAAISSGVLMSNPFVEVCSPRSSCHVGDSVLPCFRSFCSGISVSWSVMTLPWSWLLFFSRRLLDLLVVDFRRCGGSLIPASCISWLSIIASLSLCIHLDRSGSSSSKKGSSCARTRSILSMLSLKLLSPRLLGLL